jgi:hypothetical protein
LEHCNFGEGAPKGKGRRLVPIAGSIFSNVDASISTNYLVPQYVYKTDTRKVSLSSSFMGVVNWVGSNGSVRFNDLSLSRSTSNAGMGDVVIVPLTAGIHFRETNNLAVSTWIFAPTGQFKPGNLSNLGMGEWTIMPNIAHTYLWEKRGLEFDNFVGFDIYSQNSTTKYTSGTMFHWDGMVIQYLSKRVGVRCDRLQPHTDDQRSRTGSHRRNTRRAKRHCRRSHCGCRLRPRRSSYNSRNSTPIRNSRRQRAHPERLQHRSRSRRAPAGWAPKAPDDQMPSGSFRALLFAMQYVVLLTFAGRSSC